MNPRTKREITTHKASCWPYKDEIIPYKNGPKKEVAFPVSAKKPKNSLLCLLGVSDPINDLLHD